MENHRFFYGKIHYTSPFSIAMFVYQRVCVAVNGSNQVYRRHTSTEMGESGWDKGNYHASYVLVTA